MDMQASTLIRLLTSVILGMSGSYTHAHTSSAPSIHEVTGVSVNDVLNIRAAPSAKAEDVGDLQANAGPLEILETDDSGQWGRLSLPHINGWVALRYLKPVRLQTVGNTALPVALRCSGTEPFWSLSFETADTLRLSLQPESHTLASLKSAETSINYIDYPVALTAEDTAVDLSITAIIKPASCSDGMSDRQYGWEIDVLATQDLMNTLLSGCCGL